MLKFFYWFFYFFSILLTFLSKINNGNYFIIISIKINDEIYFWWRSVVLLVVALNSNWLAFFELNLWMQPDLWPSKVLFKYINLQYYQLANSIYKPNWCRTQHRSYSSSTSWWLISRIKSWGKPLINHIFTYKLKDANNKIEIKDMMPL